jgi:hypothetical protein
MTDAYSFLLALAVAAVVLSWVLFIGSRWRSGARFASSVAAVVAIVLDAASLATHLARGHRPGSPDAMPVGELLAQHPTFAVVALASTAALVLAARNPHHGRRAA